jgi:hypothetical protein
LVKEINFNKYLLSETINRPKSVSGISCYFIILVLLSTLVFAASAVAEDKPSGDYTAAQGCASQSREMVRDPTACRGVDMWFTCRYATAIDR